MIRIRPQVLSNGPGTCVPLCIIAFLSLHFVAGIIGHLFFMPRVEQVLCAMATTTEKTSSSSLCWLSRVVDLFYYWHGYSLNLLQQRGEISSYAVYNCDVISKELARNTIGLVAWNHTVQ
ncbi:hypothetical protein Peur_048200 [Populus x canadensis]